jgi:DNA-binding response OmpR family regulator
MRGLEVGCNDYLTKPVSKHELLARIATQLRIQSVWRLELERDAHEVRFSQGLQQPRSFSDLLPLSYGQL